MTAWMASILLVMSGCSARTSLPDGHARTDSAQGETGGAEDGGGMASGGAGQGGTAGSVSGGAGADSGGGSLGGGAGSENGGAAGGGTDGSAGKTGHGGAAGDGAGHGDGTGRDGGTVSGNGAGSSFLTLMIATDIHYLADGLTDGGAAFQEMVDYGDGKVVQYIGQITDALIQEAIRRKPKALILSGDLTLEGELASHRQLASRLAAVEAAGVLVLVAPGNHDINNTRACRYEGDGQSPAAYATPEDFREIYADFGYGEALDRDPYSLSYVYGLDGRTWVMMLDSCQYAPVNQVGGMVRTETFEWMQQKLEEASALGVRVIPVSHHNLLDQSEIYVGDCTIEHGEDIIDLLEGFEVPLYLSGHLHVQHYKSTTYDRDKKLYEVVTGSLATPPCLYGILEIGDSDGMAYPFSYRTGRLDMERWARENHDSTPDLLEFSTFGGPFLKRVFYHQAQRELTRMGLPAAGIERMSNYYAALNVCFYQGKGVDIAAKARGAVEYGMWEGDAYGSVLADYVEYMVRDSTLDYNRLESE